MVDLQSLLNNTIHSQPEDRGKRKIERMNLKKKKEVLFQKNGFYKLVKVFCFYLFLTHTIAFSPLRRTMLIEINIRKIRE